jgi:hypothetical protein
VFSQFFCRRNVHILCTNQLELRYCLLTLPQSMQTLRALMSLKFPNFPTISFPFQLVTFLIPRPFSSYLNGTVSLYQA